MDPSLQVVPAVLRSPTRRTSMAAAPLAVLQFAATASSSGVYADYAGSTRLAPALLRVARRTQTVLAEGCALRLENSLMGSLAVFSGFRTNRGSPERLPQVEGFS